MSENDRKRRSKWDNKEENQISTQTSEHNAWQERESYPRHLGHDSKSYDLEPNDVMNSRDFPERPSREPSPRMRGQRDANRDSFDISRSRRSGDVARSYPVSPRNHGPGQQHHIRSPERTRDYPRRRSRSRGRGRGRSQSPSGGRNRSRSPSGGRNRSRSPSGGRDRSRSPSPTRGRERDRGYGRSRSPPNDYRRDSHGGFNDRRSGFRGPPPQVCRNFTAGDCRRGSQCRFLHPDNPNPRDGGQSERDQPERWGPRGERGGSRYDVEREGVARNRNHDVCNDFLKGRCHRGSSCRFSHDAADENSHERQQHVAPCKFFMMGNCGRANCRFAHDAPMQDNHEVVPRDDRRNRDYREKNSTWNGPTWDDAEKSSHHSVVKDGGWSGSTLDDVAGGSYAGGTMGWSDRGIEDAVKTEPIMAQRNKDDELDHLDDESKRWNGPDSHDVDMEIAGSEAPTEVNKVEPNPTSGSMEYQAPYEFFKPTPTVRESVFPENSQLYGQMERNTSMPRGFDSDNGENVHANAKHTTPISGQDFNQLPDMHGFPPQQFGGIGQGQLNNSMNPSDGCYVDYNGPVQENISHFKEQKSTETQNEHPLNPVVNHNIPQQFGGISQGQFVNSMDPSHGRYVDYNGPVQQNISHFKEQNSAETQHGYPVNPVVNQNIPEMMEHKPVQISNLPSVTEKFVNEQLPQLYAALNPPKPAGAMPSNLDSVNLFPPLSSMNAQPDQTSIYQKRNSNDMEPSKVDISIQYSDFSSNSMAQNGGFVNSNHMNLQASQQKTVQEPVPEEPSNPVAEKLNKEAQNNGAGNAEANKKDRDGANLKDEKAMRLFKNSLVEFVKDILKPKWKEGGMSRDVHKAIVKKVVEKVTGAIQGVNIPNTQAKLDQYLESSRPKLAKLVEAYVERYAKTS